MVWLAASRGLGDSCLVRERPVFLMCAGSLVAEEIDPDLFQFAGVGCSPASFPD